MTQAPPCVLGIENGKTATTNARQREGFGAGSGLRSVVLAGALILILTGTVVAGEPDSPGPPASTFSLGLEDLYLRLTTGANGTSITFTETTNAPGTGTMHTIDEIRDMPANYGVPTTLPILGPSGVIEGNWSGLLDGNIFVSLAAAGVGFNGMWWSGSRTNGSYEAGCAGWTNSVFYGGPAWDETNNGSVGSSSSTDWAWINFGGTTCNAIRYIVCIAW